MSNLKELMDKCQDMLNDNTGANPEDIHIAYAIWNAEDVEGEGKAAGLDLDAEEIGDILDLVHDKQDCNDGITWATIGGAIDIIAERREE